MPKYLTRPVIPRLPQNGARRLFPRPARSPVFTRHSAFSSVAKPLRLPSGFQGMMYTGNILHGKRTAMRRLNPMKYIQRRQLIRNMPTDGTILEVYGGKGNLTRSVYKGKARHHIIIDKNPNNRLASLIGPRKVAT